MYTEQVLRLKSTKTKVTFDFRTHWKTTCCKPSTPGEELVVQGSPNESGQNYEFCASESCGGKSCVKSKYIFFYNNLY